MLAVLLKYLQMNQNDKWLFSRSLGPSCTDGPWRCLCAPCLNGRATGRDSDGSLSSSINIHRQQPGYYKHFFYFHWRQASSSSVWAATAAVKTHMTDQTDCSKKNFGLTSYTSHLQRRNHMQPLKTYTFLTCSIIVPARGWKSWFITSISLVYPKSNWFY